MSLQRIEELKWAIGLAMTAANAKKFEKGQAALCELIQLARPAPAQEEGDGGLMMLESLHHYAHESGNCLMQSALESAAHAAGFCLAEGQKITPTVGLCPLCEV